MSERTALAHSPRSQVGRRVRIIVADDDARVRDALAGLLGDHPLIEVVAVAETGDGVAALCRRLRPDVAIIDVAMPQGGAVAAQAIHRVAPSTAIVAYTARGDRRTRQDLLDSGVAAVEVKGADDGLAERIHSLGVQVARAAVDRGDDSPDGSVP